MARPGRGGRDEPPSPNRARQLETWRGIVDAVAGDADGMRAHLERAVQQATDSGFAAARCEALARLAVEAARLGADRSDDELLSVAERAADEASQLASGLPGHAPWGAQADAARAVVALARGAREDAAALALAAGDALQQARHEDANLDVLLPAAQVMRDTGAPAWEAVRPYLQLTLAMIVQRTMDEDVRVRWLRGPAGARMVELAGSDRARPTRGERARPRPTTTGCSRASCAARRIARSPRSSGSTSPP